MLIKHTILYLPAQILAPLSQFVSVVAWTHLADEKTVGVVTLITATQEFLIAAYFAFWSQYILRYRGSLDTPERQAMLKSTSAYVIAGSLVLQVATALLFLNVVIEPEASPAMQLAVAGFVVTRVVNVYLAERARTEARILQYTVQFLAGPVLGLVLGLVLLDRYGADPLWPILGFAVTQGLAAIWGGLKDRDWIGRGPFDRAILADALAYGGPIIAYGVFAWLSANSGRFLVDHMLGIAAAGAYSVGFGLGFRAASVPAMAVTAAAFPLAVKRMNAGDPQGAFAQLSNNGALLIGVIAPSVIGLALVSDDFVRLLIAPPFWEATMATLPWMLVAGAALNIRSHFVQQTFLLEGRTMPMSVLTGVEAVLSAAFGYVLILWKGLAGGAMALTLSSLVVLCAAFVVASRRGLRLPLGHLARIALASAAMAVAVLAVPQQSTLAVTLVARIAAGAAAYGLAIALLYLPDLRRMLGRRRVSASSSA